MKRTGIAGLVCVAVLAGLAAAATADELDLGVRAGYQRISGADDGNFVMGAFLRKDWHRVIFFEGAVLYHDEEYVADSGTVYDIEFIPMQLTAQIFVLRRDRMYCPYIQGGAGAYIVRKTGTGIETETDVDLGWHLGLGLDIVPADRIFFELDLRYIWLDTEFEGQTVADTLSDFDSWQATAGFGFRI